MLKVGITGNIASGKSIVENLIKNKGFLVFDLDVISHVLLNENQEVQEAILMEFETLDRKEIAKIVFNDLQKRKKLENIIHPKLKEFCLEQFKSNQRIIFISGALLFESGFDKLFDKIIYVVAQKEIRLDRLMKRNNLSKKDALLRIESQIDNRDKAEYIIENNNSIENLEIKVNSILHELVCKL